VLTLLIRERRVTLWHCGHFYGSVRVHLCLLFVR
jgi:hypothetical protein